MPQTPVEKSDASKRGLQSRRRGIEVEKKVIEFLWPDAPRDEFGSIRDHRELHDKFVLTNEAHLLALDLMEDEEITLSEATHRMLRSDSDSREEPLGYLLEIKGDAWVGGTRAMLSKLLNALRQARTNREKAGFVFTPVCAVWLPKHTKWVGDALVMLDTGNEAVDYNPIISADTFRHIYLGR